MGSNQITSVEFECIATLYNTCVIIIHSSKLAGFILVGGVGGKLPPQICQLPPQEKEF